MRTTLHPGNLRRPPGQCLVLADVMNIPLSELLYAPPLLQSVERESEWSSVRWRILHIASNRAKLLLINHTQQANGFYLIKVHQSHNQFNTPVARTYYLKSPWNFPSKPLKGHIPTRFRIAFVQRCFSQPCKKRSCLPICTPPMHIHTVFGNVPLLSNRKFVNACISMKLYQQLVLNTIVFISYVFALHFHEHLFGFIDKKAIFSKSMTIVWKSGFAEEECFI